ncbi:MAG TPA: hypothetical protein VGK03_12840 [Geothrix sp.]|jgi:hypothetical protein
MRRLLMLVLLFGWVYAGLLADEPKPCPSEIRPWLICKPGTTDLISTINGITKIFTVKVESPGNGLWIKGIYENSKYLCMSFIWDSHGDVIFILDKINNRQIRLGNRFGYYSLHGLIDPNFIVIATEEFSGPEGDEFGFVVLRLSDRKFIRVGKDAWNYQLRVEGKNIVGIKTIKPGEFYEQVPYTIPIRSVLARFK